jgi:hypothetical protein
MTMRSDSQIHRDVLHELVSDPRVAATTIGVAVGDGVVTLTGNVGRYLERRAAQEAARRVRGVLDVANDIEVRAPGAGAPTDAEIAQAVRQALEWDVLAPAGYDPLKGWTLMSVSEEAMSQGVARGAQPDVGGAAPRSPSRTVQDWPALCRAVDATIESLRDEVIGIAQELIRIPSVNHPPTGEEEACQRAVAAHLRSAGLRPEIYALDDVPGLAAHPAFWPGRDYRGRPNVVARRPGQGGGRSLVLSGHIDTVPLGTQPWQHDPFGAELAAGRLYGLGAYDMKGGVAAILGVMRALAALAVPLQGDVIAETVVDEEFGGVNGTLAGRVRGDNGDALVIPEPSNLVIHNGVRGGHVAQLRLVGREGIFSARWSRERRSGSSPICCSGWIASVPVAARTVPSGSPAHPIRCRCG